MKSPPPFASEMAARDGLFDFSCTTATRVLAVIGAEGPIPFVGAWLRERVAPAVPQTFVTRPMDENTWNACAAATLGYAFSVSTDPTFFEAYRLLMDELDLRAEDGVLGRTTGFCGRDRGDLLLRHGHGLDPRQDLTCPIRARNCAS